MSVSLDNLLKPEGQKLKPQKTVDAKTLESYHTQNLTRLREEKDTLSTLKTNLELKKKKLALFEKEFASPSLILSTNDIVILTGRQRLENEILEEEKAIRRIENGENESEYFLRIGDILFSYSDAQTRIATGEKPVESTNVRKGRVPANSVYSYFSVEEDEKIRD
jgi:hypothetical protein